MRSQGYNIARVFLDERVGCGIGQPRAIKSFSCGPLYFVWITPNEKERKVQENDFTARG